MSLDNLKLRTKIAIPLALMALMICGMGGFCGLKLSNVSATASELIDHKSRAALWLARARRRDRDRLQPI